jgi:PEP-CTERM motif
MLKSLWIIALGFASLVAPAVLRADGITYTVNQLVGPGSVTGFIATDGAIGTLATADILDWNLTLNDGHGDMTNFTPSNSTVQDSGSDLTASSSALMFNFSDGGMLVFNSTSVPYAGALCYDAATNCASSPGIDLFDVAGVLPCFFFGCSVGESGNQVIASGGTPTPTPEPGTLSSLALGLVGVRFMLVMRKRIAQGHPQAT